MSVSYKFQAPINPLVPQLSDTVPALLAQQLGSGLAVPMEVFNNLWQLLYGTAKVQQDILIAIFTPVGRRFVFPSFGSLVPYLMFEDYNPVLRQQIINTTLNAIKTWVPQVSNVSVQIDETNIESDALGINIFYTIKGTNAQQSLTIILANDPTVNLPPADFVVNRRQLFKV